MPHRKNGIPYKKTQEIYWEHMYLKKVGQVKYTSENTYKMKWDAEIE